jgi:hypothetical protein
VSIDNVTAHSVTHFLTTPAGKKNVLDVKIFAVLRSCRSRNPRAARITARSFAPACSRIRQLSDAEKSGLVRQIGEWQS